MNRREMLTTTGALIAGACVPSEGVADDCDSFTRDDSTPMGEELCYQLGGAPFLLPALIQVINADGSIASEHNVRVVYKSNGNGSMDVEVQSESDIPIPAGASVTLTACDLSVCGEASAMLYVPKSIG